MEKIGLNRGKAPFIQFVLPLIVGGIAAHVVHKSTLCYTVMLLLFGLATLVFFVLTFQKKSDFHAKGISGFLMTLILFSWAWVSIWKMHPAIDAFHFSRYRPTTIFGYVSTEPHSKKNSLSAAFQVKAIKNSSGKVIPAKGTLLLRVALNDSSMVLHYGEELMISGNVKIVPPRYNPYGFDYGQYLHNKNIWHQIYLSADKIQKTGVMSGSFVVRKALLWRSKMLAKFHYYIKSDEARAVLSTLVMGFRVDLDSELIDTYAATGTIHVLSVSGMHVGIVFACLVFMLKWMENHAKLNLLRFILLLLGIWIYVFLTGCASSVLRAGFMISFLIIGNTFRKQSNPFNHIAASAFFLLLYNPKYLFDVGFQLSYLAVIGIVWAINARKYRDIQKGNKIWNWLRSYLLLSCAAQLFTFPLVIYYFHRFPVYFLLANMMVALPASVIIYGGFLLLLSPFSGINLYLASSLETLVLHMDKLLYTIASWPMASIDGIWVNRAQCLLLYLSIAFCLKAFQAASKSALYGALGSILFLGIWVNYVKYQQYRMEKLIIFTLKKDFAIALLYHGCPIVLSNLDPVGNKQMQYNIMPTIDALSDTHKLIYLPKGMKMEGKDIMIDKHHICFKGNELFILDGKEKITPINQEVKWLLIRNNPSVQKVRQFLRGGRQALWLLDGSNTSFTINQFKKAAIEAGVNYYVLKNNFAYVWDAFKR